MQSYFEIIVPVLAITAIYLLVRFMVFIIRNEITLSGRRSSINLNLWRITGKTDLILNQSIPGEVRAATSFGMVYDSKNKKTINHCRPSREYLKDITK